MKWRTTFPTSRLRKSLPTVKAVEVLWKCDSSRLSGRERASGLPGFRAAPRIHRSPAVLSFLLTRLAQFLSRVPQPGSARAPGRGPTSGEKEEHAPGCLLRAGPRPGPPTALPSFTGSQLPQTPQRPASVLAASAASQKNDSASPSLMPSNVSTCSNITTTQAQKGLAAGQRRQLSSQPPAAFRVEERKESAPPPGTEPTILPPT